VSGSARALRRLALPVVAATLCASAWAHGLRIAAAPTDRGFAGQVLYSDDSPAANERVTLLDADRKEVSRTHTDPEGRFFVPVPAPGAYQLVAFGEEGHRAEAQLRFAPLGGVPAATVPGADPQALAAAVRRELQPLREDIARYEQRMRLHDLLGGAGVIFGLAGGYALWRSRRRAGGTTEG
jgi:nickel transport protein